MVGFCYGGGIANMLATRVPDLGGGVPFYGTPAGAGRVPKIKAPLLIHYAENDERINAGWPPYEAALKATKVQLRRRTSIRARSTASTTTPRRATTKQPRSSPGSGRSSSSTRTCEDRTR